MSKQSIINVKAERNRRASLGLCVYCAKPSLPDKFGKVWRGCAECRLEYAKEARALKNILCPEAPPKYFTAADWKPTELAEKILADKAMSERFKKRGLEVEK
jgi:hypothetical protein